MFFPVSGVEANPIMLLLVAFCICFFGSMGGISGAFLLLPFQMSFLGYTLPSVTATNHLFNVLAIPSGVYRYWREGRLMWPLVWIVIIGTLPGVFIGVFIRVHYLPNANDFKLFVAMVLFYMASKMFLDMFRKTQKDQEKAMQNKLSKAFEGNSRKKNGKTTSQMVSLNFHVLCFRCYEIEFSVPFWAIFALSLAVGIVGGIYGIGGGAVIAIFFVTFFKLPIYIVAGATLLGTFVTSLAGVAFFEVMDICYPNSSLAPDWSLGLIFGIGGALGMYCGARCQKFVSPKYIKCILILAMTITSCKYVWDFLATF